METSTMMFWSMIFGAFGLGYFSYGRKQKRIMPTACGLLLMIYPYFIGNLVLLIAVGVGLLALPYFVRA